jgi:hypothetical protein
MGRAPEEGEAEVNLVDQLVLDSVIDSERGCGALLQAMIKRGVEIKDANGAPVELRFLSHQERQRLMRRIMAELAAREGDT